MLQGPGVCLALFLSCGQRRQIRSSLYESLRGKTARRSALERELEEVQSARPGRSPAGRYSEAGSMVPGLRRRRFPVRGKCRLTHDLQRPRHTAREPNARRRAQLDLLAHRHHRRPEVHRPEFPPVARTTKDLKDRKDPKDLKDAVTTGDADSLCPWGPWGPCGPWGPWGPWCPSKTLDDYRAAIKD